MKTVRIRVGIKAFLSDGPKDTIEIHKHLNTTMRYGTTIRQLGNILSKDKDIVKVGNPMGGRRFRMDVWAVKDWVKKNIEGWKEGAEVLLDMTYSTRPLIFDVKMNVDTCVIGVSNEIMFSPLMNDLNFYNKNSKKIEHAEWMEGGLSRLHPAIRSIVNLNFRENVDFLIPNFSIGAELELRQTANESKMVRLHLSPFDVSYYFDKYLRKELAMEEVNLIDSKGNQLGDIIRLKSVPVPAFQIEPLEDSIIDGQGMEIIGRIGLSGGSIELPKWFCNLSKRFVKSRFQHSWSIDNIEVSKIEAIWGVRRAARDVPAIWVEELNNIGESDFTLLNRRIGLTKNDIDIRWNWFIHGDYGQNITDEMASRMEKLNGRKGELRINNTTGLLMTQIKSSSREWKLLREEGLFKGTYLVLQIMLNQSKSVAVLEPSTDVKSGSLLRLPRPDLSEIGLSPKTLSPEHNSELFAPLSSFIGWSISHLSRLKNDEEVEYLTKDLLGIVRKVMDGLEWDRRKNREGMMRLSEEISASPSIIAKTQLTPDDLFQDSDWPYISTFSELLDVVAESIVFAMIYLCKYDEYRNEIRINDSNAALELLRMILSPMELIDVKGQIAGYSPNRRSILSRELTDIFLHGFCLNIEMKSSQNESEIFFNRYSLIKSVNSSNSLISK